MNQNIKAVVLDVDGILVGFKGGANFPMPGAEIINALKIIKEGGTPVILCTGRPFYTPAMEKIIQTAGLDNFHIGEMGCLTANPLTGEILRRQTIEPADCRQLVRELLKENIIVNYFTAQKYFAQKNQAREEGNSLLAASVKISPEIVDSLEDNIGNLPILYVSGISQEKSAALAMEKISQSFKEKLSLAWGNNLFLTDYCYGFFLPPAASKTISLQKLLEHVGIPFKNVLGVGDGVIDWDFMRFCGYRATLQNAMPPVLENVSKGDKEHNFVGPHVDRNGILGVFRHFKLTI